MKFRINLFSVRNKNLLVFFLELHYIYNLGVGDTFMMGDTSQKQGMSFHEVYFYMFQECSYGISSYNFYTFLVNI